MSYETKLAGHLKRNQKKAARTLQGLYGVSYQAALHQVRFHMDAGHTIADVIFIAETLQHRDFSVLVQALADVRAGVNGAMERHINGGQ